MTGEKGQITLFVLLGLLLLLIIILLLVVRNAFRSDQVFQQDDATTLDQFVSSCIDNVAEATFVTLGSQGGVFQDSAFAENVTPDGPPTFGLPIPIAYGLKMDTGDCCVVPHTPAEFAAMQVQYDPTLEDPYPWPATPTDEMYPVGEPLPSGRSLALYLPDNMDGPFGQFTLPKLLDQNTQTDCGNGGCNRHFYAYARDTRQPIQLTAKLQMERLLIACLDPKTLSNLVGRQVTVGRPNVTILFGEQDTLLDINVPIAAADDGSTIRTERVQRTYPVRMLKMYRFLFELLKRESKDPRFSIDIDFSKLYHYDGFAVNKRKLSQVEAPGFDVTLVTISDSKSLINEEFWQFRFLVANRRPFIVGQQQPGKFLDNTVYLEYEVLDPDGDQLELEVTIPGVNFRQSLPLIAPTPLDLEFLPNGPHQMRLTVQEQGNPAFRDWIQYEIVKS